MTSRKKPTVHVERKPLLCSRPDHIAKMANLDQIAAKEPWTIQKFTQIIGRPRTYGIGAFDRKGDLRGYLIFDSEPKAVRVVSLLVDPRVRRCGIGGYLFDCLSQAMVKAGLKPRVVCEVDEFNDAGIGFLASYAASSGASLRTSLIRGEPHDLVSFVFTEPEDSLLCV